MENFRKACLRDSHMTLQIFENENQDTTDNVLDERFSWTDYLDDNFSCQNAEIAAQYAEFEGLERLADYLRNNYKQDYPGDVNISEPLSIRTRNNTFPHENCEQVYFRPKVVKITESLSVVGIFPEFPAIYELDIGDEALGLDRFEHEMMCNDLFAKAIDLDSSLNTHFNEEEIRQIRSRKRLSNYTWHHEPEVGRFSLVEKKLHEATPHTGGYAFWGKKDYDFYSEEE